MKIVDRDGMKKEEKMFQWRKMCIEKDNKMKRKKK